MTDDALARAKRALQLTGPRRALPAIPLPDNNKVNELLARARQAAETRLHAAEPQRVMTTASPERVRVPMTCGATGQPFIAIAERHGDVLRLTGQAFPQAGRGAGDTGLLSGMYRVETVADWCCPVCGENKDRVTGGGAWWQCRCAPFHGALHCAGSIGRGRYCACGKFEDRHFVTAESIEVRGASVAVASINPQSARPSASAATHRPGAALPRLSGRK